MKSCQRIRHLVKVLFGLLCFAGSAAAQPDSITQSTASFTSSGAKITLNCYEPRDAGKHPTIVLVHGLQSVEASKSSLDTICRAYAGRGYAVFLIHYFDRTQTSEKDIAPLLGKFKAFLAEDKPCADKTTGKQYTAWLDTLRDGLSHIRALPGVDRERLALVGLSLGSFLSLTLAAEEDQRISAVVSYFGGMPRDVAARLKTLPPVHAIHGDKDVVVPVSEAHALRKLADAKNFHLDSHIFPNAGHLFVGPKGEFQFLDAMQADAKTARFLEENLKQVRQAQRSF